MRVDAAPAKQGPARERGSIAILALWGVAVIALLLVAAAFTTRGEVLIARNAIAASRARAAAEAGVQLGLARLLRRRHDAATVFHGTPEPWQDGSTRVTIAIVDEAGRIDINQAPFDLLTGLFTAIGRPRDEAVLLACNILDRRGDPTPACPEPAGAGIPAPRRDYRFAAPEELAQLPGFDDFLYDSIADLITVASGASAIDPTVAPRAVLLALPGATEALVDSYLSSRAMWRDLAVAGTALKTLPSSPLLMASPRREFTIQAVAATADRARYRADLQIRLTDQAHQPYVVLAWRAPPVERNQWVPSVRRAP